MLSFGAKYNKYINKTELNVTNLFLVDAFGDLDQDIEIRWGIPPHGHN